MGRIGAPELLIILAVVLLLFGATRLPSLARSLGESLKEFRKGVEHEAQEASDDSESSEGSKGSERSESGS